MKYITIWYTAENVVGIGEEIPVLGISMFSFLTMFSQLLWSRVFQIWKTLSEARISNAVCWNHFTHSRVCWSVCSRWPLKTLRQNELYFYFKTFFNFLSRCFLQRIWCVLEKMKERVFKHVPYFCPSSHYIPSPIVFVGGASFVILTYVIYFLREILSKCGQKM